MFFVQLMVQFVNFDPGPFQCFSATRGDLVNAPAAPPSALERRPQQAAPLEAMQEWVKSSGADAVAVMRQFLHHGQSKDRLMASVDKHVNPYESEKQLSLWFQHKTNIPLAARWRIACYRISI